MIHYSVFILYLAFSGAAASFNVQTTVVDGTGSSVNELLEPFKKIGENYYLIESGVKRTWLGAAHFCRTKGAHLASIESEEEWKTISSHLVSKGFTDQHWFWIAGNDIDTPFKFFWINTGEAMLFTKWSAGQPDNLGGNERCVHLWRKGNDFLMNDWQCHQNAYYICKTNNPKTISITVW